HAAVPAGAAAVAGPADLRRVVDGLVAGQHKLSATRNQSSGTSQLLSPEPAASSASSTIAPTSAPNGRFDAAGAANCEATIRAALHVATAPFATTTVSYRGAAAEVAVYATPSGTLAAMFDPTRPACHLYMTQSQRSH